ncbi:MAG: phage major capsid protein, partial [Actinoplanes sp.]
ILAEVKTAQDITDTAIREERDLSDVEIETIDGLMKKAAEIKGRADKEAAFKAQMSDLTAGLGLAKDDPERAMQKMRTDTPAEAAKRMSIGSRFAGSAEYKSLLANVPNGKFSEKMRVQSNPMDVPGGMKDLFFSGDRDDSAGFLVEDDKRGLLSPFYQRPLSIRSLVASGSTTSDTIEYVRMINVDNNAAVVPEARSADPIGGAVTTVIGGVKPQSYFEFERDSTTVKTIAHWIPITKRALSDAGQIRTMIDSFLRYGLEEALEDELLTGNGTGEHFLGLYNTPGIQTQAGPGAGEDNLDVLKKARTKVRIGGRANPTAYVMNPLDWEQIELMRNDNGDFYGQGPFALTAPRLWGLPVVESEAVTPGTAWVADWNWAVLYDREQASVQATDSHADFFVRNLVAILAEMRAAFAVLRPVAFVKVTLG